MLPPNDKVHRMKNLYTHESGFGKKKSPEFRQNKLKIASFVKIRTMPIENRNTENLYHDEQKVINIQINRRKKKFFGC